MFSLCFFMLDLFPTLLELLWKYLKVPLHLLVKWEWFLQIVDIGKLNGMWFPQIVDGDSRDLYPIYIYIQKIVVLASEPVGGRSRATELPCFLLEMKLPKKGTNELPKYALDWIALQVIFKVRKVKFGGLLVCANFLKNGRIFYFIL